MKDDSGTYRYKIGDRLSTVDAIHARYILLERRGNTMPILYRDECQIEFQQDLLKQFCMDVEGGHFDPIPLPFTLDKIIQIREESDFDWKDSEKFYSLRAFYRSIL